MQILVIIGYEVLAWHVDVVARDQIIGFLTRRPRNTYKPMFLHVKMYRILPTTVKLQPAIFHMQAHGRIDIVLE